MKIENLSGSRTKRQAEGSLRIKVFYHKSVDDLVPSEKRLVKKVVSFAFFILFPYLINANLQTKQRNNNHFIEKPPIVCTQNGDVTITT